MKQIAMAVMILLAAGSAHAENEYAEWRFTGSISYSDYERDDGTVSDGGTGIKISQQYRFNKWVGFEAAFYDSPEFKDDFTPDTPGGESETSYQGLSFNSIGYLPSPSEKIDFFLKGGYFYFFNVDLTIDGIEVDDTTEDGLTFGVGSAIKVTDKVGLRVEFDWYDVSGADLWAIGIGAEFRF